MDACFAYNQNCSADFEHFMHLHLTYKCTPQTHTYTYFVSIKHFSKRQEYIKDSSIEAVPYNTGGQLNRTLTILFVFFLFDDYKLLSPCLTTNSETKFVFHISLCLDILLMHISL